MLSATLGMAYALTSSLQPNYQVGSAEANAWKSVRSTVVTIQQNGSDKGIAVCIDTKGLFIAHRSVTNFPLLFGKTENGMLVQLVVKAVDPATQMTLLSAEPSGGLNLKAATLADETEAAKESAFAIVPKSAIATEIVSLDRPGMLEFSKRIVPLIELRFEVPMQRIGGSPIFSKSGQLLGFLTATVSTNEPTRNAQAKSDLTAQNGFAKLSPTQAVPMYGPAGLTVGYALGPAAMNRVIEGFLSRDRKVVFPAIGVMITDAKPEGAEIREVAESSSASTAGLKAGDVILKIGTQKIRNQVDYAKAMLLQKVGEKIDIEVLRGEEKIILSVVPRS